MIGPIPTGSLASAEISATISDTLRVTLADGRPGKLAIVDELDVVVDSSPLVADEVFLVAVACYKNFLIGQGHIVVRSQPVPGIGALDGETGRQSERSADKP